MNKSKEIIMVRGEWLLREEVGKIVIGRMNPLSSGVWRCSVSLPVGNYLGVSLFCVFLIAEKNFLAH